jgi:hypothetical protein
MYFFLGFMVGSFLMRLERDWHYQKRTDELERVHEKRLKMELSTSNGTLEPAWDEEDEKNWTVDG